MKTRILYRQHSLDGRRMADIKCSHCTWSETVQQVGELRILLKSAWSVGLEHAWDNRGHVVETFVDGRLKATQQVAEMSPWVDHRSLVVEEGS